MGKTTDLTAALQKYFQKEGAADRVAELLPAMTALGHQRRDLPKLQTDNVKACDAMFCYLKHLQVWLYTCQPTVTPADPRLSKISYTPAGAGCGL